MKELKLDYPVYSIENKLLVPAGTLLSNENINELASSNRNKIKIKPLLEFKSIKKDILGFLDQDNYQIVFQDNKTREKIITLMGKVRLPLPVLETIYYFNEYDFYTYRHMLIVSALATLLSIDLLNDSEKLINEIIASPTHDIGKISIPAGILKKQTPLNKTEEKMLHSHTLAGYVLLTHYFKDPNNLSARISRDHHERRDGSGYPSAIAINDLLTEIVMVSDIFDALISPRSYRSKSFDKRTALEEITELAKIGKINRNIVKALISHNRKNKPHFSECIICDQKRGTPPEDNFYGIILDDDKDSDKTL